MDIDFSSLNASQRYHIMTQTIMPRPIAWVLTENTSGEKYNLAPFSYFNAVSSEPPLVMLSMSVKPSGDMKDTRENIFSQKQLVIHIPSVEDAQHVAESAKPLAYGESEVTQSHLELTAHPGWSLPRLAHCQVAMDCVLHDSITIANSAQAVVFCEVKNVYVADEAVREDAKGRLEIVAEKVNPLGRIGANQYVSFGTPFSTK